MIRNKLRTELLPASLLTIFTVYSKKLKHLTLQLRIRHCKQYFLFTDAMFSHIIQQRLKPYRQQPPSIFKFEKMQTETIDNRWNKGKAHKCQKEIVIIVLIIKKRKELCVYGRKERTGLHHGLFLPRSPPVTMTCTHVYKLLAHNTQGTPSQSCREGFYLLKLSLPFLFVCLH